MWIFTPIGFFSATLTNPSYRELPKEQQQGHIMVRARVRGDLKRLVALHQNHEVGEAPEILALKGHDYPYRIVMPHREWVVLASILATDIDYSNFKNAVEEQAPSPEAGAARHDLYMKVWSVMYGAERWLRECMTKRRDNYVSFLASKGNGSSATAALDFWRDGQHFPAREAQAADYLDDERADIEALYAEHERQAIQAEPPTSYEGVTASRPKRRPRKKRARGKA